MTPVPPVPYLAENQTRTAAPTDYENRLGDALEQIFRTGVVDLDVLVAGLNDAGVDDPEGRPWTERTFTDEMRRLGA